MKTLNSSKKRFWLPIAFVVGMACIVQSAHTAGMGSEGGAGGAADQGEVMRKSPTFMEADKNGDHYVTKEELKDYPYLLKYFDKVDAGETGRLEEHEYGNLIMEKSREKGR
ncbi:hypothetical protein V2P20_18130 [Methylobacter sp. Wu1]|uniref:hypothetical protein n=1 Tax=Methylobacter sp. Wu1 TaxID=3119359 RepID=UPI002F91E978